MPLIQVRFPEAPPTQYLRWMAYWRQVEALMLSRPALAEHAAEQAAPFIREPIADYLSDVVIPQIIKQASEADRLGRPMVMPVLEVDPELLAKGLDYVARRGAWLLTVAEKSIPRLAPELVELRARAVEFVKPQLKPEGGDEPRPTPVG